MKIKVKYYTYLRKLIGKSQESFEVSCETTLLEFLQKNICTQSNAIKEYLLSEEERELSSQIIFFINGTKCLDRNTCLNNGDEISILSPIAGG